MLAALRSWVRARLRGDDSGAFPIWGRRSPMLVGYDACIGGEGSFPDGEATQRADLMLREELGPRYDLLLRDGFLDVPSSLFKNTFYRLRLQRPIEVIKNGRRQPWRLCVISLERVPPADEFLMKYLWLTANEEYVLSTANRVR